MAVELDFEWTAEISNEEISEGSFETLMALLNLDSVPTVHVEGSVKSREGSVLISTEEMAKVEMLIYQMEASRLKTLACVSYAVFRAPASCCCIGDGKKKSRVLVKDCANLYRLGPSLNPDETLERLGIRGEPGPFESQVNLLTKAIRNQSSCL